MWNRLAGTVLAGALLAGPACTSWPDQHSTDVVAGSQGGSLLHWPAEAVVDPREQQGGSWLNWPEGPESTAPERGFTGEGASIVRAAESVKGRPYRLGADGPDAFDCSGLVYYAHRQAGHEVPRTTDTQFRNARPVSREGRRPGDLIFFAIDGISVSHVGIYGGDGRFIHSPSPGSQVSWADLEDPYWRGRFAGVGRLY